MKNVIRLLMLMGLVWMISSCAFIFGLKDPKTERLEDIYKFYRKAGIDTSAVLFIKPNYIDSLRLQSHKGMEPGFRPLQFRLFDTTGRLVSHWASCEGPRKRYGVLEGFPPKNLLLPLDTFITLQREFEAIDSTVKIPVYHDEGYTMFIYSQLWSGKFSKWITKDLIRYCQVYNISNVYVLNTDYR